MFDYNFFSKHIYTFAVEGLKEKDMAFSTRQAANSYMYHIIDKYGLQLKEVWDDKHYKTYVFANGIRIHINRE